MQALFTDNLLAVACNRAVALEAAEEMARQLRLPLLRNVDPATVASARYLLLYDAGGVGLVQTGRKVPGVVRAEFAEGTVNHRRHYGGGKGQMIAKAVGLKAGVTLDVLDVTAGLGRDGFVLACLGCAVTLVERSLLVHALLENGLSRAAAHACRQQDMELEVILSKITLHRAEGRRYLAALPESFRPDVIYLDPMFPERNKSASVKKEMRLFHDLVGRDADADELVPLALEKARYRVVVKRPRKAPALAGPKPGHTLEGKSSRYDIYARKSIPATDGKNAPGG